MPTSKNSKPAEKAPNKEDAVLPPDAPVELEVEGIAAPVGPTMGRSALAVKEVIPFSWKVVALGDVILTLFKSIERKDCDAQLERLMGEGYYTELSILENTALVVQPKLPDPPKGKKTKGKEVPAKAAADKHGKGAPPFRKSDKVVEAKPGARSPLKPAAKPKEAERKAAPKAPPKEKPVAKKKEATPKKSKVVGKPVKKKA